MNVCVGVLIGMGIPPHSIITQANRHVCTSVLYVIILKHAHLCWPLDGAHIDVKTVSCALIHVYVSGIWWHLTLSFNHTTQRPTITKTCDPQLADLIKCCWKEDAKVMAAESVIIIIPNLALFPGSPCHLMVWGTWEPCYVQLLCTKIVFGFGLCMHGKT